MWHELITKKSCPVEVKRQIWLIDEKLFRDEVLPLLNQYVNDSGLSSDHNEMHIDIPLPPNKRWAVICGCVVLDRRVSALCVRTWVDVREWMYVSGCTWVDVRECVYVSVGREGGGREGVREYGHYMSMHMWVLGE